jgi:hypothetical protein
MSECGAPATHLDYTANRKDVCDEHKAASSEWQQISMAYPEPVRCPQACRPLLFQNGEGSRVPFCPDCEIEDIHVFLRLDCVHPHAMSVDDFLALPVTTTIQ